VRKRSYAPRRFWSDSEIAQLRERYPTTPTKVLAAVIGHSVSSTYGKAFELGLKKSAEYLAGPDACRLRRGDAVGASTRFRPGQESWNKGKRFVAGGRSGETRFQPGSKPHNWKPVGTYRLSKDGTLQRKVTDTGYPPRDCG